jgi:acyl-coenzyme A thioesterase 13
MRVEDRLRRLSREGGFETTCGFVPVSFGDGRAVVEMVATKALQNPNGALHGGAIAALIDHAGTLAIMSEDREARPGVTTDLNISYLSPGRGEERVVAEATVLKVGKTLATVTVDVRRKLDGTLVAQGRMTKYQVELARAPG